MTQPIFQGGALAGQYRFSKSRYEELLAGYHKAVISAFANAEDALIAVQQTRELHRAPARGGHAGGAGLPLRAGADARRHHQRAYSS